MDDESLDQFMAAAELSHAINAVGIGGEGAKRRLKTLNFSTVSV